MDIALWILGAVLSALLLFYSFVRAPALATAFPEADKLWHCLAFASTITVYLLAAVWRPGRGEGAFPRAAPVIVAAAVATAVLIEILQGAFFHRDAQVLDAVAGSVGTLAAFGAWIGLRAALG